MEVLFEAGSEICRRAVIGFFILPGVAWHEKFAWHVWAGGGDVQAEDGIGDCLHVIQRAVDGGSHHRTGVIDVDAFANAVGAT